MPMLPADSDQVLKSVVIKALKVLNDYNQSGLRLLFFQLVAY